MPNTERTFADRLGRAKLLLSAIEDFTPAFAPAAPDLRVAEFDVFVAALEAANDKTSDEKDTYSTQSASRAETVKQVKALALQAMSYVKSNPAWARHHATLKPTYDKLRGYRTARDVVPVEPPATAVEKKAIKSGQQSFADIEGLFGKFLKALGKVPGYAPPAAEITIPALTTLDTALSDLNEELAALSAALSITIKERFDAFEQLTKKNLAIKAAALAQYGTSSAEYKSIKGIKP